MCDGTLLMAYKQALLDVREVVDRWTADTLSYRHEDDYRQEIAVILMATLDRDEDDAAGR